MSEGNSGDGNGALPDGSLSKSAQSLNLPLNFIWIDLTLAVSFWDPMTHCKCLAHEFSGDILQVRGAMTFPPSVQLLSEY